MEYYTLPYQQVEWIEGDGTPWINTEIYPTINTKIQYKFITYSSNTVTIGNYVSDSDGYRTFGGNGDICFDCGSGWNKGRICSSRTEKFGDIYEYEIGNRYIKNLQTETYVAQGTTQTFSQKTYPILINGNDTWSEHNRIYYVKIYESDTLVRDFIPCYRKSDEEIGLWDLVTNEFYGNSGTGTFTKGSDVN